VRPEDLELVRPNGDASLTGIITRIAFQGAYLDVTLRCQAGDAPPFEVLVRHHQPFAVTTGETWSIAPKPRRPSEPG
jgi:hypothetical protein